MKRYLRYFGLFAVVFVAQNIKADDKAAKVIACPAPPGLQTSPDIKVTVNTVPVWVNLRRLVTLYPEYEIT